jgi:hypothetical protein
LIERKSPRSRLGYLAAMDAAPHFQQFLDAAAAEAPGQRLLFVFAAAELPDGATPAQRRRFAEGRGGALSPLMCVDKAPREVGGFEALAAESQRAGPPWQVMFAAALAGRDGAAPEHGAVEQALQTMVDAVRAGAVGRFAAFDAAGRAISIA